MTTDPQNLLDVDPAGGEPAQPEPLDAEEYQPGPPRPDLAGTASEADVIEQTLELPEPLDEDDYAESESESDPSEAGDDDEA